MKKILFLHQAWAHAHACKASNRRSRDPVCRFACCGERGLCFGLVSILASLMVHQFAAVRHLSEKSLCYKQLHRRRLFSILLHRLAAFSHCVLGTHLPTSPSARDRQQSQLCVRLVPIVRLLHVRSVLAPGVRYGGRHSAQPRNLPRRRSSIRIIAVFPSFAYELSARMQGRL